MNARRISRSYNAVVATTVFFFGCNGRPYTAFDLTVDAEDCYSEGRYAEAARLYERALELAPGATEPTVSYCFFLAACPDARFRDGQRALALMSRVRPKSQSNWRTCSTMAAVYAELGDFTKAQEWQQRALSMSPANAASELRRGLEAISRGRAFRVKPPLCDQ